MWRIVICGNGIVADNDSNGVPDLRFGGIGSGEGVASTRASGGTNQYGVDLSTDYMPRLSVSNGGLVGLGTTTPTELLHLQGGSLYINGGNILVSGDVTTGVGAFYATSTKVADSGGCYYGS